ncbi:MAG TPA: FUSC family protein [Stellaceae bacterium]|nr:FUSC family protein [Stellaceae bacterium]
MKLADDVKEYPPRREIIAATGDVIKLQREEFRAVAAACCVPAIVIVLVCGLVVGQPFAALVATAGAFSVGFGLFQRLSSFTVAPMLLALVGMTISPAIGTLASASPLSEGIAAAAHRVIDFSIGYWIAMTILIVQRSELRDTVRITVTRIIGTMAGAGVATIIVSFVQPSQTILVALIAVMAWGCHASLRVSYALFSMLITGYITLLFAFGGLPEPAVALDRVIATAIGGAVALAAHFSLRRPSCAPWRRHQRTATSLLSRSYWARTAPAPERRSRGCGVTRLSRDRGSSGRQKEPEIDSCQGSHAAPRRLST